MAPLYCKVPASFCCNLWQKSTWAICLLYRMNKYIYSKKCIRRQYICSQSHINIFMSGCVTRAHTAFESTLHGLLKSWWCCGQRENALIYPAVVWRVCTIHFNAYFGFDYLFSSKKIKISLISGWYNTCQKSLLFSSKHWHCNSILNQMFLSKVGMQNSS